MKLNDLKPNLAKKHRKRKGHGISAGQGKTAGRGTKGQGARTGEGGHLYRQGGNLPFFRRLPFIRGKGFTPPTEVEFNEVNLDQLERFKADAAPERRQDFASFRAEREPLLSRFACFEVLRHRYNKPWWEWPKSWRESWRNWTPPGFRRFRFGP